MKYQPGDLHMVVSHAWRSLKVYRGDGTLLLTSDALTVGTGGGPDVVGGDTPFGDYRFTGEIVPTAPRDDYNMAVYGPWFLGLFDVDGQERGRGRSGIGMHGGRQGAYAPDPAHQHLLYPTHGCIRVYNDVLPHLVDLVRDTIKSGHMAVVTVGP